MGALQGMFESQIATVQDKLEAIFVERLDQLQASVDSLNDRMGIVERDFSMEREKYIRDIEDKNAMVAKDVNNLQDAFENEKVDRKEREFLIAKKLGDHETRTQGKFEQEQSARDEKFQTFILEEVAALKNGLVLESQSREQADDDIVQALNHYTKALQDALRIVNQA